MNGIIARAEKETYGKRRPYKWSILADQTSPSGDILGRAGPIACPLYAPPLSVNNTAPFM